jgi:hypothetical protein
MFPERVSQGECAGDNAGQPEGRVGGDETLEGHGGIRAEFGLSGRLRFVAFASAI